MKSQEHTSPSGLGPFISDPRREAVLSIFCSPLSLSCLAQSRQFTAVNFDGSILCWKLGDWDAVAFLYMWPLSSRECAAISIAPSFPCGTQVHLWLLPSRRVWKHHCWICWSLVSVHWLWFSTVNCSKLYTVFGELCLGPKKGGCGRRIMILMAWLVSKDLTGKQKWRALGKFIKVL